MYNVKYNNSGQDGEQAVTQPIDRYDQIHKMVCEMLNVVDAHVPEAKKSKGAFGDYLAGQLYKLLERTFEEAESEEYYKDMATIETLTNKWKDRVKND